MLCAMIPHGVKCKVRGQRKKYHLNGVRWGELDYSTVTDSIRPHHLGHVTGVFRASDGKTFGLYVRTFAGEYITVQHDGVEGMKTENTKKKKG